MLHENDDDGSERERKRERERRGKPELTVIFKIQLQDRSCERATVVGFVHPLLKIFPSEKKQNICIVGVHLALAISSKSVWRCRESIITNNLPQNEGKTPKDLSVEFHGYERIEDFL